MHVVEIKQRPNGRCQAACTACRWRGRAYAPEWARWARIEGEQHQQTLA